MALLIFLSCPNRFHLGKEENWRPFRSLEDFAVGGGRTEPWAQSMRRGIGGGQKTQRCREMLGKTAHTAALSH